MTQKITTAACKQALAQAWTEKFGTDLADQLQKWKRVSKRGKSGEPIERVFYHQSLPLQALVVETDGVITQTVIRGFAPFDFDGESDSQSETEAAMHDRASSNAAFEFLSKYPCYKPSDFIFRMCTAEEAKRDGTWYQLFPTRDFGRQDAPYDGQLDYLIASYLPEGDGEVCEGTFSTERSIEESRRELLRIGFISDEETQLSSSEMTAADQSVKVGRGYVFFIIEHSHDEHSFGIVAREYWQQHQSLAEHEPEGLRALLPKTFSLAMESIWEYRGSMHDGRAKLIELGFEEVQDPNR